MQRRTERLRDALDQPRRGERFHDLAAAMFLAHEVEREQRDDLVRRDEVAALVEDAEAVGVAVVADGEVVFAGEHDVARGGEVLGDRLGIHAAERRVGVAADAVEDQIRRRFEAALDDARGADVVDAEDARRQRGGNTVNRIVNDGQLRVADQRDVELPSNRVQVVIDDVLFADASPCSAARCGAATPGGAPDAVRNGPIHLRQRRAAVPRLELHAVVFRGIVAGGDDDSAKHFAMTSREGDRLRRRRPVAHDDAISAIAKHLGGRERKLAREETAVVAGDERVAVDVRGRLERSRGGGDRGGDAADVIEREVVCDHVAPAVGAERDLAGHVRRL